PEYYLKSGVDSEGNDIRGLAQIIIAKHRSGATADVDLRFVGDYARFENLNESSFVQPMQMGSKLNQGGDIPADPIASQLHGGTADFLQKAPDEAPY
ncbi:MAG: DnaB-like helicase C-terminal domain-containing protein, partial [Muribaculaceae bacterium]|nr:DnaB-like helicase C-terminal domain-containing protein [Muribaculaceae bacterium]